MERIQYDAYGGPDLMHLAAFELPPPAANQVEVHVAAASVNPFDWKVREGEMKLFIGSHLRDAIALVAALESGQRVSGKTIIQLEKEV